jgi:hypothetical protein
MDIAVIRMIEEMNQGRPRQIPTVLNSKVTADCKVRTNCEEVLSSEELMSQ